jgi:quercetin dioxygenase-like cupin family protein
MSTTPVADVSSWQLTASRAAHPSQRTTPLLHPGDLLLEIAAGIGAATVPLEVPGQQASSLQRELVLSTPAYDVWVMNWPAGRAADLHTHDRFVAFHVVSGSLVEERLLTAGSSRRTHPTGSTTLVAPNTPHRLESTTASTTVHVHAKDMQ